MSLGASMAISAGSVFVDASASSPMSPQLKSPGSVPTFNSPSESPAARKKWKPSPTLWQRLAAQAESIMHQVVTCCSKDPRDKSYLVRVPTYPFVTEGEREKDEAEVVAEEEALVSSPSALSASPRTTFRPSLRNHEQFEAVLSAQFRAVTERRGKRRERKEFEKVRKKDRLTEQPEHRSNDIKVAALAAKFPARLKERHQAHLAEISEKASDDTLQAAAAAVATIVASNHAEPQGGPPAEPEGAPSDVVRLSADAAAARGR